MKCAWNELLAILPARMRSDTDRLGKSDLRELRLRLGKPPLLRLKSGSVALPGAVQPEELQFVVNAASRYSPWTATSAASGYLTAPGGHRVGICGEALLRQGEMVGIGTIGSLNVRVARDIPGIAESIVSLGGNVLLVGPPGSGKTTLLRDLIRLRSRREQICVVDQRGEIFPQGFDTGPGTDVLRGCGKAAGMEAVLRAMGPDTIAVDEITAAADCTALVYAGWCGVGLLATAHAAGREDLLRRPVYRPIVDSALFDHLVILRPDQSFRAERMKA